MFVAVELIVILLDPSSTSCMLVPAIKETVSTAPKDGVKLISTFKDC